MEIIKLFQNGRYYRSKTSSYISLSIINEMICDDLKLKVIDQKTKRCITKETLIKIENRLKKKYQTSEKMLIVSIKLLNIKNK